jgi:NDP-sugar pyrophosphorylase family protein
MKAILLCAGHGTRLGDLTQQCPKAMLELEGRPLLAWLLGHLRSQGFREVGINLHFRPEMIQERFGDGTRWQMRLTYSLEDTLLGTAGALTRFEEYLGADDVFLVQYGDILTDQDFTVLVERHRARGALATLLIHRRPGSNSVVTLDPDSRVTGFLERPSDQERHGVDSAWVNSGVCICSRELLRHIPAGRASDLPRDVFVRLAGTGRLFAVPLEGYRCAIDSPKRLEEARSAVSEGRCRIEVLP